MKTLLQKFALFGASLLLLTNCESRDFGNKDADTVSMQNATWEGGIGELINMKCANCHTAVRSEYVPANTPKELNEINTKEFWNNPENLSIFTEAKHRLTEDEDKPMPPKFATPLMGVEKELLVKFIDAQIQQIGLAAKTEPNPPSEHCKQLPDWNDDIGKAVVSSCSNGTCHADATRGGFKKPTLETEAQWMAAREKARLLIGAGAMPKGVKGFASSDTGKLLLGTLCIKTTETEKPLAISKHIKVVLKQVDSNGVDRDVTRVVGYDVVKPLMANNCVTCHNKKEADLGNAGFLSFEDRPFTSFGVPVDEKGFVNTALDRIASVDSPMPPKLDDGTPRKIDPALPVALKNWMEHDLPEVSTVLPLDSVTTVNCEVTTTAEGETKRETLSLVKDSARQYSVSLKAIPGSAIIVDCSVAAVLPKGAWTGLKGQFTVSSTTEAPEIDAVFTESAPVAVVPPVVTPVVVPPVAAPKCDVVQRDWDPEIEAALKNNCSKCHSKTDNAAKKPLLTNEQEWMAVRDVARAAISNNKMPKGKPEDLDAFGKSDAKLRLLGTYCPPRV